MTNKEYANAFQTLAKLMELHEENSYRIKSYSNAYRIIRGVSDPVHEMTLTEVKQIKGIGDAIGLKIMELQQDGKMKMLEEYKASTPPGIVQLLSIKGLGIKKIKTLWQELEIQSPGELLYACHENRLITLKGFGSKTQATLKKQLEYFFQSIDKFHFAKLEEEAENLVLDIQETLGTELVALTGKIRRLEPILEAIAIIVGQQDIQAIFDEQLLTLVQKKEAAPIYHCKTIEQGFPVIICTSDPDFFGYNLLRTTGTEQFNKDLFETVFSPAIDWRHNNPEQLKGLQEAEIFAAAGLAFIEPEIRDISKIIFKAQSNKVPQLIQEQDIKGILHAHSTWSDGANTLEQMASYVRDQGYEYLGITDHSKSAFYANGLSVERVLEQMEEIDALNQKLAPFHIFKGIESDILYDGSLDYTPEILAKFDFVIASIHSTLRMDKEKATQRLITAIKNPYTTILGHPTGRILLSRQGYPIDHQAVIDACAEHNVVIEINANPLRLDLDHTWIPYALEKGVKIAVNPDAHNLDGVHDVHFGVLAARKGLLNKEMCVNCLSTDAFAALIKN
ncbi:DNA polymerase/3'-5' exonuclease PolX [Aureispira anguillae]|uniref:PHP domain-containing protein n=1 Tax=Aureispira anguillae TaxID=2864201 RepID=A0A915YFE8_9BACT|nr:DNA polymerase/3'-5' exonuclease PolX [Aureispira anguillae]BDS12034.1 PHP domain-containing protein [Aureispira anguillae]